MADYFNAQGLNPGTNFKPDGFLGGYIWGQDRNRYEQMAPLQDYMQILSAQEQENKMRDYGLNETVRATQREADIAKNRATAGTIGDLKRAEVEEKNVANDYNRLTLKDRAKKVILENAKMEGEAAGEKMKRGAMLAGLYAEAAKNGPIAMQQVDALAAQLGMQNDDVVKAIKADPRAAGVLVQAYAEAMPEYRRAMDQQRLQNQGALAVEGARGTNQRALEKERQSRATKSLEQRINGAKTDEEQIRVFAEVDSLQRAGYEVEPRLYSIAKARHDAAVKNLEAKRDPRFQSQFPGMPPQQRTPYGVPNPDAPVVPETNTGLPPGVRKLD